MCDGTDCGAGNGERGSGRLLAHMYRLNHWLWACLCVFATIQQCSGALNVNRGRRFEGNVGGSHDDVIAKAYPMLRRSLENVVVQNAAIHIGNALTEEYRHPALLIVRFSNLTVVWVSRVPGQPTSRYEPEVRSVKVLAVRESSPLTRLVKPKISFNFYVGSWSVPGVPYSKCNEYWQKIGKITGSFGNSNPCPLANVKKLSSGVRALLGGFGLALRSLSERMSILRTALHF